MRVLVSGATGFVGRRLVRRLLEDDFEVRCLVRDADGDAAGGLALSGAQLFELDLRDGAGLVAAMEGVEAAYFLVHMIGEDEDYAETERAAAERFARAASEAGVGRVIYVGGLGDERTSEHLQSRHEAAKALEREGPPLTYFRAAMIIGAGSESYELLRGIVERLPAMPAPDWLHTETQPIGVDDVVDYLREALDVPESAGREIQIGGPEVLTHLDLVNEMAAALGRRAPRRLPVSGEIARPRTIAAAAGAVTSGRSEVATALSLGLTEPTVVSDPSGAELFGVRPLPLDAVLAQAIDVDEEDEA